MAARGKDTTMKTIVEDRAQARAQALAQVLVAVLALVLAPVLVPVLMLAIWVFKTRDNAAVPRQPDLAPVESVVPYETVASA
jgi:hypothetical protein